MEETLPMPLKFIDDIASFDLMAMPRNVTHILCLEGSLSFVLDHTRYNLIRGDYLILTTGLFATSFSKSDDCQIIAMTFPDNLLNNDTIKSNYGVFGHLSLLQNPVMKLSEHDFENCRYDLVRLRQRMSEPHLFKEELIIALLKAHVLDLYDIHARANVAVSIESRPAQIMRDFIALLLDKEYMTHRSVDYYAAKLCVVPHYLSEISKQVSLQPASYWIERFTVRELTSMLADTSLSFDDITFRMNFSSLSYFSRYVKKTIGMTPSEYRQSIKKVTPKIKISQPR